MAPHEICCIPPTSCKPPLHGLLQFTWFPVDGRLDSFQSFKIKGNSAMSILHASPHRLAWGQAHHLWNKFSDLPVTDSGHL